MKFDLAIRNSGQLTSGGTYATRIEAEADAVRVINEVNIALGRYYGFESIENIVIVEVEEK